LPPRPDKSGDNSRKFFTYRRIFHLPGQILELYGQEIMDNELPVPEYYDNEWDIAGTKPGKSSHLYPAGDRIASATEEYNTSTLSLAFVKAWISGYLSH
jgi:hypothetical protein